MGEPKAELAKSLLSIALFLDGPGKIASSQSTTNHGVRQEGEALHVKDGRLLRKPLLIHVRALKLGLVRGTVLDTHPERLPEES